MASTSISAITVLLSGVATGGSGIVTASGNTCTITGPTGGQLDLNTLMIRVTNAATGSGAYITVNAGTSTYSSIGQGDYTVASCGTASTVWIGGKGLESARFVNASADSLILTFKTPSTSASTCYCVVEAFQQPFEITG
jgi:hypothetical protein